MELEHIIYHLAPAAYFDGLPADQPYLPREFERDGFMHCTKGEERMLLVADTVYRRVPGDFVLLMIDERRVTAPIKYENSGGLLFPHIYGPLNRDAIVRVAAMGRREDGTFLLIGEPDTAADRAALTEAWYSQARVEQLLAESADVRARTSERLDQIERAILELKSPTPTSASVPPKAQPAAAGAPAPTQASVPPVPVTTVIPVTAASAPIPALEARLERVERSLHQLAARIESLETQIAGLATKIAQPAVAQPAGAKAAGAKARKPAARKTPSRRK